MIAFKPILRAIRLMAGLACLASAICSCRYIQPCFFVHSLIVVLPESPFAWDGIAPDRWRVEWKDAESEKREAFLPAGGRTRIEVPRGEFQAILAYPESMGAVFKPAGFLYPEDLGPSGPWPWAEDVAVFSYESGYGSEVARHLEVLGMRPSAYTLSSLGEAAISGGADPWDLPPWKAARALAGGTFRKSLFVRALHEFALPDGETWAPESPFKSIDRSGAAHRVFLAEGLSLFHSERSSLLVDMREDGARFMAWER
ncbi:MAG TPA: hypothetical protein VIO60_08820 [Rectinemataceae bacterium]